MPGTQPINKSQPPEFQETQQSKDINKKLFSSGSDALKKFIASEQKKKAALKRRIVLGIVKLAN